MCTSWKLASMASVRGVNVPMYTTLRRTTVAFTMVIEYMLTGQRYTRSIIGRWITVSSYTPWFFLDAQLNSCKIDVSVGVIIFGAFFAGARDLSFDFYGYAIVFLANITTAVYLATIARIGTVNQTTFFIKFLYSLALSLTSGFYREIKWLE